MRINYCWYSNEPFDAWHNYVFELNTVWEELLNFNTNTPRKLNLLIFVSNSLCIFSLEHIVPRGISCSPAWVHLSWGRFPSLWHFCNADWQTTVLLLFLCVYFISVLSPRPAMSSDRLWHPSASVPRPVTALQLGEPGGHDIRRLFPSRRPFRQWFPRPIICRRLFP